MQVNPNPVLWHPGFPVNKNVIERSRWSAHSIVSFWVGAIIALLLGIFHCPFILSERTDYKATIILSPISQYDTDFTTLVDTIKKELGEENVEEYVYDETKKSNDCDLYDCLKKIVDLEKGKQRYVIAVNPFTSHFQSKEWLDIVKKCREKGIQFGAVVSQPDDLPAVWYSHPTRRVALPDKIVKKDVEYSFASTPFHCFFRNFDKLKDRDNIQCEVIMSGSGHENKIELIPNIVANVNEKGKVFSYIPFGKDFIKNTLIGVETQLIDNDKKPILCTYTPIETIPPRSLYIPLNNAYDNNSEEKNHRILPYDITSEDNTYPMNGHKIIINTGLFWNLLQTDRSDINGGIEIFDEKKNSEDYYIEELNSIKYQTVILDASFPFGKNSDKEQATCKSNYIDSSLWNRIDNVLHAVKIFRENGGTVIIIGNNPMLFEKENDKLNQIITRISSEELAIKDNSNQEYRRVILAFDDTQKALESVVGSLPPKTGQERKKMIEKASNYLIGSGVGTTSDPELKSILSGMILDSQTEFAIDILTSLAESFNHPGLYWELQGRPMFYRFEKPEYDENHPESDRFVEKNIDRWKTAYNDAEGEVTTDGMTYERFLAYLTTVRPKQSDLVFAFFPDTSFNHNWKWTLFDKGEFIRRNGKTVQKPEYPIFSLNELTQNKDFITYGRDRIKNILKYKLAEKLQTIDCTESLQNGDKESPFYSLFHYFVNNCLKLSFTPPLTKVEVDASQWETLVETKDNHIPIVLKAKDNNNKGNLLLALLDTTFENSTTAVPSSLYIEEINSGNCPKRISYRDIELYVTNPQKLENEMKKRIIIKQITTCKIDNSLTISEMPIDCECAKDWCGFNKNSEKKDGICRDCLKCLLVQECNLLKLTTVDDRFVYAYIPPMYYDKTDSKYRPGQFDEFFMGSPASQMIEVLLEMYKPTYPFEVYCHQLPGTFTILAKGEQAKSPWKVDIVEDSSTPSLTLEFKSKDNQCTITAPNGWKNNIITDTVIPCRITIQNQNKPAKVIVKFDDKYDKQFYISSYKTGCQIKEQLFPYHYKWQPIYYTGYILDLLTAGTHTKSFQENVLTKRAETDDRISSSVERSIMVLQPNEPLENINKFLSQFIDHGSRSRHYRLWFLISALFLYSGVFLTFFRKHN